MNDDRIRRIIKTCRRIAVVGLSDDPVKPSYQVSKYLKDHGYVVIPVNPSMTEWMGEKSYPDVASIPERPDIVVVFRRPERAVQFVKQTAAAGVPVVWLQESVGSEEAERLAGELGLEIIMDKCIKKEHHRLVDRR
ncbi:MAG: CoA-binding protein [Candidatus Aquicultorales bacterium]